MADLLPFAKRDPRVHPCGDPTPYKVLRDPVVFHSPLNKQSIVDRDIQEGNLRQVDMKVNVRAIDGRLDEVERNRMNLFNEANKFREKTIKPLPIPDRATKHGKTPYSYSTAWITHPPDNTSLSPLKSEAYLTSFLATPNANIDHIKRAKSTQSKYDSIRYNEEKFESFIENIDNSIKEKHQKNMSDIREQRAKYQVSLDARHRLEHVHYFD